MPLISLNQGTAEDWQAVGAANQDRDKHMPERIKGMLRELERVEGGFPVNQQQHALQTATRAEQANATEEMIVAALCHDIGKCLNVSNHAPLSAELLRPYVSIETYQIILYHQDFQGRHYYHFFGKDPDARWRHRLCSWYKAACQFADEWDQKSFDPDFEPYTLEHFEPMIDRVFAKANPQFFQDIAPRRLIGQIVRTLARLMAAGSVP